MRKIVQGSISTIYIVTVLLVLIAVFPPGAVYGETKKEEPPFWWRVELRLLVQGDYRYQKSEKGFQGRYSFVSVLLGSMQPDEGDYLFFQAFQNAAKIKWRETAIDGSGKEKWKDFSNAVKPEITLNYVFRERGKLLFDFDIAPVDVPFSTVGADIKERKLVLPTGAGDASVTSKAAYGKGIINGSNVLVLRNQDILDKEKDTVNRTYQWIWKSKKKGWLTRHKVKVYLKIIRLNKVDGEPNG